jgi:hypothetical protein
MRIKAKAIIILPIMIKIQLNMQTMTAGENYDEIIMSSLEPKYIFWKINLPLR